MTAASSTAVLSPEEPPSPSVDRLYSSQAAEWASPTARAGSIATKSPSRTDHPIDLRRPIVTSPYPGAPHLLDLLRIDEYPECQALALAAQALAPTTFQYTDIKEFPPSRAFNWAAIHSRFYQKLPFFLERHGKRLSTASNPNSALRARNFHVITFHSTLLPSADRNRLGTLDQDAHAEAMELSNSALLKYWFGSKPDSLNRNLAMCIWKSKEDAALAAGNHAQPPRRPASGPRSGSPTVDPDGSPLSPEHPQPEFVSAHIKAKRAVPEMYAKIVISEWKLRVEWYEERTRDNHEDVQDPVDIPDNLERFETLSSGDPDQPDWRLELVRSRQVM